MYEFKEAKERREIQIQIKELNELIRENMQLDGSTPIEEGKVEVIEQQIRVLNDQASNQEDFLNRICSDLFQNVVESHQLISSMQEIEEVLVQDYQKLLFCQKNQLQTPQVQQLIATLSESIRENEEIKDKMKVVLETNQEQKCNLKYVLLRIANRKSIQLEYDVINLNKFVTKGMITLFYNELKSYFSQLFEMKFGYFLNLQNGL